VAATFASNCYSLSITINGSGTVQTSPDSSGGCPFHQYSQNTIVSVSGTPASGYLLYGWGGTDNDYLLTTSVTMSGNRSITATFIVVGGPTPTPAPPTPTPTRTPVPTLPPGTPTGVLGDVDCNDAVNSIDAALTLQLVAGLVASLPCPENADADGSGSISSIDSALMLQFGAGLLVSLPGAT
jgi:hypothetical protein